MPKLVLMMLIHVAWLAAEAVAGTPTQPADPGRGISFETQAVRLMLSAGGEVLGLVDR